MGFSERFPRWTSAVIGVIQLALTIAIIGLEIRSVYIDLAHGTIYVGFWAGIIFLKTIILMFFITCCCRGRCCATYVFIWTVFSGLLACVMIYFDRIFLSNLCKCYLGNELCCAVRSVDSYRSNYTAILETCVQAISDGTIGNYQCVNYPAAKFQIIQAQLGCAVGMLITCGIYVVIYLFACLGICFGHD